VHGSAQAGNSKSAPANVELRGRGRWHRPRCARTERTIPENPVAPGNISGHFGDGHRCHGGRHTGARPLVSLAACCRTGSGRSGEWSSGRAVSLARRAGSAPGRGSPAWSSKHSNPCRLAPSLCPAPPALMAGLGPATARGYWRLVASISRPAGRSAPRTDRVWLPEG